MTYFIILTTVLLVSFAATALLVPLVRRLAFKKRWFDVPDDHRKRHARPTPNVGGITIVGGFVVGASYLLLVQEMLPFQMAESSMMFWIGALLISGVGFYDDVRGLDFRAKFVVQIALAYLLVCSGYRIDVASLAFVDASPYQQALYSLPLSLIWIVGIINAVNLIDGLDGLASGVVLIAITFLALTFGLQGEIGIALLALPIIGALLAFLLHNFNPASIFMGDSGSLFLGFLLAAYSLQGPIHADPFFALLVPVMVLGLLVLDTGLSVARRYVHRKAICSPDHDHIHHRLVRHYGHRQAVLLLYAAALLFGAAAVVITLTSPIVGLIVTSLVAFLCSAGVWALGYVRLSKTERRARLLTRRARRVSRLSWEEWKVLTKVTLLITVTRVLLALFPYGIVQALYGRFSSRTHGRRNSDLYRRRLLWAVSAVGRRFLGDRPCLTQALVVHSLFRRRGQPAALRIGVAKGDNDRLLAHAWVECEGKVLIGGRQPDSVYTPLQPIGAYA